MSLPCPLILWGMEVFPFYVGGQPTSRVVVNVQNWIGRTERGSHKTGKVRYMLLNRSELLLPDCSDECGFGQLTVGKNEGLVKKSTKLNLSSRKISIRGGDFMYDEGDFHRYKAQNVSICGTEAVF